MRGREINFTTDKYNKPVYLSKRKSLAQVIENAMFMRVGNNPSHPDRGVDIEQYLNRPVDAVDELKLLDDLKRTCGDDMIGNDITSLSFNVVRDDDGNEIAIILLHIMIDDTDDIMSIAIQREKDSIVRYQYNFINEDVPI